MKNYKIDKLLIKKLLKISTEVKEFLNPHHYLPPRVDRNHVFSRQHLLHIVLRCRFGEANPGYFRHRQYSTGRILLD